MLCRRVAKHVAIGIASCVLLAQFLTMSTYTIIDAPASSTEFLNKTNESSLNFQYKPVMLDDIGDMVNDGKAVLELVDNSVKVEHGSSDWPSAVPRKCPWHEMTNWHSKHNVHFKHICVKNIMSATLIEFRSVWRYEYGGSCRGVGQYLHNVQLDIYDLWVRRSWNVAIKLTVATPINIGSVDDPIAQLSFTEDIRFTPSWFNAHSPMYSHNYVTVTGDGKWSLREAPKLLLVRQSALSTSVIIGSVATLTVIMATWCRRSSLFTSQDDYTAFPPDVA